MTGIRPFRPGDEHALARVCLLTADAGRDATGVLSDDAIWAQIFVLPYLARHPEFAFVVESATGEAVGYVVCAPDTDAFERWFREQWWPDRGAPWQGSVAGGREAEILRDARARGTTSSRYGTAYPAHLHIDLLPEAQGRGWGRRLIDTLREALKEAGVPGVHLVADAANTGAAAFYERLGFTALESEPGSRAFGSSLIGDTAPYGVSLPLWRI